MRSSGRFLGLILALALAGCGKKLPESAPVRVQAEQTKPTDDRPVVLAFGDSLTAGHGVEAGLSYPDFLQKELDGRGYRYRVVNEGLSGDTTSGGLSRADAAAATKPAVVILELGGNDGLRGLPLEITRSNLEQMIQIFVRGGARVVLAGMTLPRNYGPDYIRNFEQIYRDLSKQYEVRLIPFLLEGVAMQPGLMQRDGIHPTAEGNRRVAEIVLRALEPLLRR